MLEQAWPSISQDNPATCPMMSDMHLCSIAVHGAHSGCVCTTLDYNPGLHRGLTPARGCREADATGERDVCTRRQGSI